METNIYEWIYLIRQNDHEALSNLIQYFRPAITQIWADFFNRPHNVFLVEKEDFFVDADEILLNCISFYRHDFNRSFKAYYKQCVKNKGIDYSRVKSMQRFDGIYAQVSLDSHIRDNERFYYVDLIKDDFDVNEFVLNNLYKEMIMEKARLSFNEKAYEIIELRLSGYRYAEISRILSVEKNKIYYVWKKFKNWLIEIDSLDI